MDSAAGLGGGQGSAGEVWIKGYYTALLTTAEQWRHIVGGVTSALFSVLKLSSRSLCPRANIACLLNINHVAHGGLVVIVIVTVPEVRGFKPDREQWILTRRQKSVAWDLLRRGSKTIGPLSQGLWHVKNPEEYGKILRQKNSPSFLAKFLMIRCWYLSKSSGWWIRNYQNSDGDAQ
jgi:hypothetical protein